jgi:predicted aminopeptidase
MSMRRKFLDNSTAKKPSPASRFFRPLDSTLGKLLVVAVLALVVSATVSACSPLYVLRAAYEEGKILWRREAIAELIEKPEVTRENQEKLKLVLAVREFARDALKLNVGGSYASFSYVDRPDLTYLVLAAPQTELRPYTWWFLIVGSVPYKGYFSKADADAEIRRLQAEGYDTTLRTSAAFSTLGWFNDPLLSHLLRFDKISLAEVVFHELFHNTLYLKGQGAFNESSANFVGHRAAIDFFREKFGAGSAEHEQALRSWEEQKEFGEFIYSVARTLTELYRSQISRDDKLRIRETVFSRSKAEWTRRIAARPQHRFRNFAQQPLNNAVLMHYIVYLKDLDLFEALYESQGRDLVRTIEAVRQATEKGGEAFEAVRLWLKKHQPIS